jgi:hypothetical protein
VGPRVGLDAVAKSNKSHHCPCQELNSSRPARSLVTIPTELLLLYGNIRYLSVSKVTVYELGSDYRHRQ